MKTLILSIAILLTGCANTYSASQVGPDRFVVASKGRDISASNYSKLLVNAYSDCRSLGYSDYRVTQVAPGEESVAVFVQCSKEPVRVESLKSGEPVTQTASTTDTLKEIWGEGKKKFDEAVQLGKPQ